jgi:hypothetical protein
MRVTASTLLSALIFLALAGCSGNKTTVAPSQSTGTFTVSLDAETPLLTATQRTAFGFAFGPPDGTGNGSFTEPGTGGDPNAATNSGHYTPVVAAAGSFPSVIYDTVTSQWVMVYEQDNDSVHMRHGSSLINWSTSDDAGGSFTNAPNGEIYTTLIGESGDPNVSNGNPYLIYVKASVPWPSWPNATVMERVVHLSLH